MDFYYLFEEHCSETESECLRRCVLDTTSADVYLKLWELQLLPPSACCGLQEHSCAQTVVTGLGERYSQTSEVAGSSADLCLAVFQQSNT